MKPISGSKRPPSGNEASDQWTPYKLWVGDLWECQGCNNQIIVGALHPLSEHYRDDFEDAVSKAGATIKVNDC
jgi:hypothetical protein